MSHLHHRVSALVDGELHGAARARALNHARRCADCRHELEATSALKRRMAGLSLAQPSADLFSSLDRHSLGERRRTALCPPGSTMVGARLRPIARRVLVGAGSVSVAVLSLAYAVGGASEVAASSVTPPVDEYASDFAGDTGLAPLSDPAVDVLAGGAQPVTTLSSGGGSPVTLASYQDPLPAGDDPRAVAELRRVLSAPNEYAYRGVQQVETLDGGPATTSTLHVEHVPGQGSSFGPDDRPASNATAIFLTEREAAASGGLSRAPLDALVDAYDLAVVSPATVLDRPAMVVAASRGGVIGARFWIDDATGLLVRRELYAGGRLARSTGFTELRISRDGFLRHLPPQVGATSTTELSMTSALALNDDGWLCPPTLLHGFVLVRLDHLDTGGDVVLAQYTDGLSTLALFEQHGALDPGALDGFTETSTGGHQVFLRYGLPTMAVWASDGTVVTAVTDAPGDLATEMIASLPRTGPRSAGVGSRMATGLQRIESFVNLPN